jgi:hypothetical protein
MTEKPADFEDEFFGALKWDEECGWFSGTATFSNGESIEVALAPKRKEEIGGFIREAKKLFAELEQKLPRIYADVRQEYLKLYNESWSKVVNGLGQPVGHGRISGDQFDGYVGLESISFENDGNVELYFYDNDELFGGHSIHVRLDQSLNIRNTGLEG